MWLIARRMPLARRGASHTSTQSNYRADTRLRKACLLISYLSGPELNGAPSFRPPLQIPQPRLAIGSSVNRALQSRAWPSLPFTYLPPPASSALVASSSTHASLLSPGRHTSSSLVLCTARQSSRPPAHLASLSPSVPAPSALPLDARFPPSLGAHRIEIQSPKLLPLHPCPYCLDQAMKIEIDTWIFSSPSSPLFVFVLPLVSPPFGDAFVPFFPF